MPNIKTNAMRLLDTAGVAYQTHTYDHSDGLIDGISVAQKMGQPVESVYKTLVTQGSNREFYIFVIPVAKELSLKVAAKAVNEMIKVADINKVTGYIRGGCSPIGMKKPFRTVVDRSCLALETMIVSAGKIGHQIELAPNDLIRLANGSVEDIVL